MVPIFQQGLDDLSPGLRIEPDLVGQGWRWTIVDPASLRSPRILHVGSGYAKSFEPKALTQFT
jgi:hypothetical protein